MATSQELATKAIEAFKQNPQQSRKIRDVLVDILRSEGLGPNAAVDEAERLSSKVLDVLANMRPQDLPFDFGSKDQSLLVGKRRIRPKDTEENIRARKVFKFVDEIREAIVEETDRAFECLCALCLKMSGAYEAYASCADDDGGIDIYGRISIGKPIETIDAKLLETNILSGKKVLLLGQAKKYDKMKIGRPEIQSFLEAVNMCINQYEGNPLPPSHRVPMEYYRKNELFIPVFMTASDFSNKAEAAALSRNLVTVMGRQIAEFLCSRNIGFIKEDGEYRFSKEIFHEWLMKESDGVKRKY